MMGFAYSMYWVSLDSTGRKHRRGERAAIARQELVSVSRSVTPSIKV